MPSFTPVESLIGGLFLGANVSAMMAMNGRVAGCSGILANLTSKADFLWRRMYVAGMTLGSLYMYTSHHDRLFGKGSPSFLNNVSDLSGWSISNIIPYVISGFLVGYGSQLGSGCTSGHMLCGFARLSPRSIFASATFMIAGAASVFMFNRSDHLGASTLQLPDETSFNVMARDLAIILAGYAVIYLLSRSGSLASDVLENLNSFWSGLAFATGLGYSGMANPDKIIGFLTFDKYKWDPSLMFVAGGGVLPTAILYHMGIVNMPAPVLCKTFQLPNKGAIDVALVLGAAMFGTGFGFAGLCPGPLWVSVTSGAPGLVCALLALAGGMYTYKRLPLPPAIANQVLLSFKGPRSPKCGCP
eukprot:Colp12_sorted_trinity150504_noHs@700